MSGGLKGVSGQEGSGLRILRVGSFSSDYLNRGFDKY